VEVYGQVLYIFCAAILVAGLILLLVLIGYLTNNFNKIKATDQSIFKQISRDSTFFKVIFYQALSLRLTKKNL
jgi:hypothetical protein